MQRVVLGLDQVAPAPASAEPAFTCAEPEPLDAMKLPARLHSNRGRGEGKGVGDGFSSIGTKRLSIVSKFSEFGE
jgi:hypothetical protein